MLINIIKPDIGIPTRMAYFGEGNGPIHLSSAHCTSTDDRLINCSVNTTGINGCMHSEDAGVICIGKNESSHKYSHFQYK